MSRELRVVLEGNVAGTLARQTNGRLHYEYDASYRNQPNPTPLSVSMPVAQAAYGHATVSPWLSGLLPDNPDVVRRWARQFGASSTEPFALLATPIGEDCAGAVQFAPPSRLEAIASSPGSVEWLTKGDVEVRLRELRADATAWLGDASVERRPGFVGRFSLAGRQRKTALLYEGGRWGVPSGRIPTTHILKPPIEGLQDQELNEHLCLAAARRLGLAAADSRIEVFGNESAVVIKRYDRIRRSGQLSRIHQEDACQALGVPPERKYQAEGGPGPAEIVGLLRSVMPHPLAEASVRRFADALIWNWAVAGTDAHAKNYSLLLAGRQVRLAPLYDITSALPYENERHLRLAMKVGDTYDLIDYRNPWPVAAGRLRVDLDWIIVRALELCEAIPAAFHAVAADSSVQNLAHVATRHLLERVERRAERCIATLRV